MIQKKRIAIVTSTFFPAIGGSEIAAYNIASALKKSGHDPYIFVNFKNYIYFLNKKIDIKLLPLPPLIFSKLEKNSRIVLLVTRCLFSVYHFFWKFDHWYANTGYPAGIITADFCRKYKYKCTLRCGGEDIQILQSINYGFRINKNIEKLISKFYPEFDRVIALNKQMVSSYEELGIQKTKIYLLPNAVNIKFKEGRYTQNIDNKIFTFLSVGRNHIKKDFLTLVNALPILTKISNVKFKLIFVGSGYDSIKRQVNNLNIGNLVKFKSITHKGITDYTKLSLPPSEMIDVYKGSNCFISPSLIEGFPNSVAEAMTLGLPIIASDTPGNIDLVDDYITGLLYSVEHSRDLAVAMKTIMENEAFAKKLGESGQRHAEKWSYKKVSKLYLESFNLLE